MVAVKIPDNVRVLPGLPMTAEDVAWARKRPVGLRTPIPEVGQVVDYRHDLNGPVVPARVLAVLLDDGTDPNVWRVKIDESSTEHLRAPVLDENGNYVMELVDDPWPDVRLKVEGHAGHAITREARLPGSTGWLPRKD